MDRLLAIEPALLRLLLDGGGDAAVITDLDGVPVRWNDAAARAFDLDETVDARWLMSDRASLDGAGRRSLPSEDPVQRALRGEAVHDVDVCVVSRRPGEPATWWSVSARRATTSSGEACGAFVALRDVTARRAVDAQLRASEQLYRMLARHIPDTTIVVYDHNLRIRLMDGPALARAGRRAEEFEGLTLRQAIASPRYEALEEHYRAALEGREAAYTSESHGRSYRASVVPLPGPAGEVMGGLIVIHDVTDIVVSEAERLRAVEERRIEAERRAMEARLTQADRIMAVGTLAVGIAHEINNPLASNLMNLEAALERMAHDDELAPSSREYLEDAMHQACVSARRIQTIVKDMQVLARGGTTARRRVDLHSVIDRVLNISAPHVRPRARVVRDFGPLALVEANESQLGQVFLNLILNAVQALPEGEGARHAITLRTRADGDAAVIEVQDTGEGMADEVRRRVFEPFFTTKPVGVGTGLGLAISHSIVANHGGDIEVESAPGEGTTFRVTLPIVGRRAGESARPQSTTPPGDRPRHRLRVLVIDDDNELARALQLSLREAYEVEVLHSGRDALARLRRGPTPDVVLCDLMMPELSGTQLYEHIADAPELARRFVFITGGAFDADAPDAVRITPVPLVHKPFDLQTLRAVIEECASRVATHTLDAAG